MEGLHGRCRRPAFPCDGTIGLLRKPELSVVGLAEEVAEDLTTSRDSAIGVDVVPQSILLGLPLAHAWNGHQETINVGGSCQGCKRARPMPPMEVPN